MKFYILGSVLVVTILFVFFLIIVIQYRSHLISKKIKSYILIPLRVISILILLILLLEPYLSYPDYSFKNKLNIYIDNSRSIGYNNITSESLLTITEYFDEWDKEQDIRVQVFTFGDSVADHLNKGFNLNSNVTNFSNLKSYIDKKINTSNIIISDGNSTEGYNLSDLNFEHPINFIGVGFLDYQDISIEDVKHKYLIAKEDSLKINFSIDSNLKSKTQSQLIVSSNNLIIHQEDILLYKGKNRYKESIMIPSSNLDSDFNLEIKNSLLEDNKFNNIYRGRVTIRDLAKSALLVSGALSSNTKYIKDILYLIPNLSFNHMYKTNSGWTEDIQELIIEDYDLIIYDNFPLDKKDSDFINFITKNKKINSRHVIFEGTSFTLSSFNQINRELSIEIIDDDKKSNFILNRKDWPKFLPSVDRNFRLSKNKFKDIYLQYSDSSIAIAEDKDYLFLAIPDLSSLFIKDLSGNFKKILSEVIYKYIDSGTSIKLDIPNREIYMGQNLEFYLDFPYIYENSKGELLIQNLDLNFKSEIKLNRIKKNSEGIRYIDNLEEGRNILSVNLFDDNKIYKSNKIELLVKENNLELQKIYRNSEGMKDIAIKSGGNYYDIEEYKNIKTSILNSLEDKNRRIELDVHSFDKFWFIILITLIIEWFFRKQKGLL